MNLVEKVFAIAAMAGAAQATAADRSIWRGCVIDSVQICTAKGCIAGRPAIWIYVASYQEKGRNEAFYLRCNADKGDCDDLTPIVNQSGSFVDFSLPDRGVISRLGPDDRLTDIATIMDTVVVSHGKCKNEAPPLVPDKPPDPVDVPYPVFKGP